MKLPENFDIEERARRARQNFLDGYNCCQAVMLAFSDVFGADENTLAAVASGFGGGMARMREVCGTVSAMGMAAGFISPAVRPKNMEERTANYALVQELAGEFRKENGSIICRELLGLGRKDGAAAGDAVRGAAGGQETAAPSAAFGSPVPAALEPPKPSDRTPEYYRKRPCPELVACSARIIAGKLKELEQTQSAISFSIQ